VISVEKSCNIDVLKPVRDGALDGNNVLYSRAGFKRAIPMNENAGKRAIRKLLDLADVRIGGDRPWDIQVRNQGFFARVLAEGSLGLGESYMDGWWECDALDRFFARVLRAKLDRRARTNREVLWAAMKARVLNTQRRAKAFDIGKRHYDIDNDLFAVMLDKGMNYSCGYWREAEGLDAAQEAKMDLVCRKMGLASGMTLLDIGCGWGGFVKYAAETYGVKVIGITVSREQAEFARVFCRGLPVEIRLQDYRELRQRFDRIISIGMFEHVGFRNYRTYMRVVHRCLESKGLFLLHTIAGNSSTTTTDPWIDKYIFPNSMLPSSRQIASSVEGFFVLEDWHGFGPHYDKTLMAWHRNFNARWEDIRNNYDERFHRMWNYYLLSCAGCFRSRRNQLWQIVFSKDGVRGGYESIR